MKEEMQSLFQGLGNENGSGLGEVPYIDVRKMRIDTHAILSVVRQ